MSVAQSFTPQTVRVSERAVDRLKALLTDENNPGLNLRVYVTGGGCSGFQYGFKFDENREDDDTAIRNGGVTLLVDAMSVQYLSGAEIDFADDVEGSHFVIRNPNAATSCGCGSSFSV